MRSRGAVMLTCRSPRRARRHNRRGGLPRPGAASPSSGLSSGRTRAPGSSDASTRYQPRPRDATSQWVWGWKRALLGSHRAERRLALLRALHWPFRVCVWFYFSFFVEISTEIAWNRRVGGVVVTRVGIFSEFAIIAVLLRKKKRNRTIISYSCRYLRQ